MYCFIKYTDPKNLDAASVTEETSQKSKEVIKSADEYIETIIVNPNCYTQILLDHINKIIGNDKNEPYDLCNTNGELKEINKLAPNQYATDVLTPKDTYFVVKLEYSANQTIINAIPLLCVNTKLYAEMHFKLRKYLIFPTKSSIITAKKSQSYAKSKSKISISSISVASKKSINIKEVSLEIQ